MLSYIRLVLNRWHPNMLQSKPLLGPKAKRRWC